jgi:hypothetical protein
MIGLVYIIQLIHTLGPQRKLFMGAPQAIGHGIMSSCIQGSHRLEANHRVPLLDPSSLDQG